MAAWPTQLLYVPKLCNVPTRMGKYALAHTDTRVSRVQALPACQHLLCATHQIIMDFIDLPKPLNYIMLGMIGAVVRATTVSALALLAAWSSLQTTTTTTTLHFLRCSTRCSPLCLLLCFVC